MLKTIYSIFFLLLSFAIVCVGHGLQNTLVSIRATIEQYPDWLTGLIMAGSYFGFIFGTGFCARMIPKVGQIRTFAAFASGASAISLLYVITLNPYMWILLRVLYGACLACLYVTIESWISQVSRAENRGRILSFYMITKFVSFGLSQFFLISFKADSFILFAIISILFSLSLIPLCLSESTKQPEEIKTGRFSLKKLYAISPLAVVGSFGGGIILGTFTSLTPVYLLKLGVDTEHVAKYMMITYLGALLLQWPIGTLSDKLNRRYAIAGSIGMVLLTSLAILFLQTGDHLKNTNYFILICFFLYGGFCYPLYSIFLSLANDFAEKKYFVKVSASLSRVQGIGLMVGPILGSIFIEIFGVRGLFLFLSATSGLTLFFTVLRIQVDRQRPKVTTFVLTPTAPLSLDPRIASDESREV
ncbi:MAG: MFS transporter [Alphaproteobacteria bacterium]